MDEKRERRCERCGNLVGNRCRLSALEPCRFTPRRSDAGESEVFMKFIGFLLVLLAIVIAFRMILG